MKSRDKESNDMARYRTVNGYSPFIVEFKQPDPFYEGDDYRGGFIVYAREREDAERFAARNGVVTSYRVVEPENISDDSFPSLSEYKFPGFKGIVTTVFAEHDGSMTPLSGLTYGAREFLRSRDDESRYENLRRELAERYGRLA